MGIEDRGCPRPAPCSAALPCPECQTCNASTGLCEAGADGTACADGDACTTGDACQGGVCTGTPARCEEPPACRTTAGATCQAGQGICVYPTLVPDLTDCGSDQVCCGGDCAACCTDAHCTTAAAPTCLGQTCVCPTNGNVPCDAGDLLRGRVFDLKTDPSHCGACGNACGENETCQQVLPVRQWRGLRQRTGSPSQMRASIRATARPIATLHRSAPRMARVAPAWRRRAATWCASRWTSFLPLGPATATRSAHIASSRSGLGWCASRTRECSPVTSTLAARARSGRDSPARDGPAARCPRNEHIGLFSSTDSGSQSHVQVIETRKS